MKRFLFISLIAALALAACGSMAAAPQASYDYAAEPEMMFAEAPAEAMEKSVADFESNTATGSGFEAAEVKRMVIQNADLSIVVADPETKMEYYLICGLPSHGYRSAFSYVELIAKLPLAIVVDIITAPVQILMYYALSVSADAWS